MKKKKKEECLTLNNKRCLPVTVLLMSPKPQTSSGGARSWGSSVVSSDLGQFPRAKLDAAVVQQSEATLLCRVARRRGETTAFRDLVRKPPFEALARHERA